jgi:hypothetical protein
LRHLGLYDSPILFYILYLFPLFSVLFVFSRHISCFICVCIYVTITQNPRGNFVVAYILKSCLVAAVCLSYICISVGWFKWWMAMFLFVMIWIYLHLRVYMYVCIYKFMYQENTKTEYKTFYCNLNFSFTFSHA